MEPMRPLLTVALLALLGGSAAAEPQRPGAPDRVEIRRPAPPPSVFAYVIRPGALNPVTGQPLEELRLAALQNTGVYWAHDLQTLANNVGDGSPESFRRLAASPHNSRLVAYSTQLPLGAIDHNLRVYNLRTPGSVLQFNEHSLTNLIHHASCPSPAFDAVIAGEAAGGAPASLLATYDFRISVEGPDAGNVPDIQAINWIDDQTLLLHWPLNILIGPPGAEFVERTETFDLQVRITGAQPALAGCTPAALNAPPQPIVILDPSGSGPTGPIRADGHTVVFSLKAPKPLPPAGPGRPPFRRPTRQALMAAGNIPR